MHFWILYLCKRFPCPFFLVKISKIDPHAIRANVVQYLVTERWRMTWRTLEERRPEDTLEQYYYWPLQTLRGHPWLIQVTQVRELTERINHFVINVNLHHFRFQNAINLFAQFKEILFWVLEKLLKMDFYGRGFSEIWRL